MKKAYLFFIVFTIIGFGSSLFAQSIRPSKIMKPVHFDISKPLRDVQPIQNKDGDMSWKKREIINKLGMPVVVGDTCIAKSGK